MESLSKEDNALSSFPNVILGQLSYPCIPFRLPIVCAEATFVHVLSSNYLDVISQFGVSFATIMSTFYISTTPKVHILLHHIPQFICMAQMPLGLFSEEVVEEQHKRF